MSTRASSRPLGLAERIRNLSAAAELSVGRIDDAVVEEARRVVAQVDQRMALSGEHTVVALAGATGSGKSSLFNAISGTQLAEPGVRRPTTTRTMVASWGDAEPTALLDWLEVTRRHRVTGGDPLLDGLVLLDLPDHDSTHAENRAEVDRLVKLVDVFVWVLDPQKYADAALHDRYLVPMRDHAGVMLIVLNQADRLTPEQLDACLGDLRSILDREGLGAAGLVATSALTGQGVDDVRTLLAHRVSTKQAAAQRLVGDVGRVAGRLREGLGDRASGSVDDGHVRELNRSLAEAAGAEAVIDAVGQATRQRGVRATGWPLVTWLTWFRPDPLKRLHLDALPGVGKVGGARRELEPASVQRTSLPRGNHVARARVDSAVRNLADAAAAGLPRGWRDGLLRAARRNDDVLADELDRAVASADLGMGRRNHAWTVFRALQWALIAAVVVGTVWLLADVVLAYFQLPPLPKAYVAGQLGWPTVLVIGGAVAGVVVGLAGRGMVEVTARSRAAFARRELDDAVAEVSGELIVRPVNTELKRHRRAWEAVQGL